MFDVSGYLIAFDGPTQKKQLYAFRYSCSKGQMMAYVNLISSEIDRAVCDKNSQLVWKTETGEVYGKTLQATCAFRKRLLILLSGQKLCPCIGSRQLPIREVILCE